MSSNNFYNGMQRFMVTNAVIGSAASKMADLRREEAVKITKMREFYSYYKSDNELAYQIGIFLQCKMISDAFKYLNDNLRLEMIHDCQNQKEFKEHLSELIETRKAKYRPFYEKIGLHMPEDLEKMTAEQICSFMSVELMSPGQLKKYHDEKEAAEWADKLVENIGLAFRAILIIGLFILIMYLLYQS